MLCATGSSIMFGRLNFPINVYWTGPGHIYWVGSPKVPNNVWVAEPVHKDFQIGDHHGVFLDWFEKSKRLGSDEDSVINSMLIIGNILKP